MMRAEPHLAQPATPSRPAALSSGIVGASGMASSTTYVYDVGTLRLQVDNVTSVLVNWPKMATEHYKAMRTNTMRNYFGEAMLERLVPSSPRAANRCGVSFPTHGHVADFIQSSKSCRLATPSNEKAKRWSRGCSGRLLRSSRPTAALSQRFSTRPQTTTYADYCELVIHGLSSYRWW